MERPQLIIEWWNNNAAVISLGLLIVGGVTAIAAWWRHRSLIGRIDDLKDQNQDLAKKTNEILRLMQDMKGRPVAEQERIIAEAKRITISATAGFGPITSSATLRKRPAGTEEEP